jgi:hypothetical protein
MATVIVEGCTRQFQHFISNSPWDHEAVVAQISQDADRLLGGNTSSLMIDESSFAKQGDRPVGVARQWSGRPGKVDICQVAVFGVLTTASGMRRWTCGCICRKPGSTIRHGASERPGTQGRAPAQKLQVPANRSRWEAW